MPRVRSPNNVVKSYRAWSSTHPLSSLLSVFPVLMVAGVDDESARGVQEAKSSKAAAELLAVAEMVNQAVGDAISGILLVEAALRRRQWRLRELAGIYSDLPSCMLKVRNQGRIVTQRRLRLSLELLMMCRCIAHRVPHAAGESA